MINKKKKDLYADKLWYKNTYDSLGSQWLINSLKKIQFNEGYVFVSLSANAGYYERDAYEKFKNEYHPTYYVGDIEASKLKDKKVQSYENFIYIEGDNNAFNMDISMISHKAAIILDCKGALWYAIYDKGNGKKELKRLLLNYKNILKDDSAILLIDYYKMPSIKYFFQNLILMVKNSNNKKQIVKYFGEESTYKYLIELMGKRYIDTILKPLDIKKMINGKPLSKYMDSAYFTRQDIGSLIEKIDSMPNFKFRFVRCLRAIKFIFFSLLVLILFISLFAILVFCIFKIFGWILIFKI